MVSVFGPHTHRQSIGGAGFAVDTSPSTLTDNNHESVHGDVVPRPDSYETMHIDSGVTEYPTYHECSITAAGC